MPTIPASEIDAHRDGCPDGDRCEFLTASAWAERVAAPGHADEVRESAMARHLADLTARDHFSSVQTLTTLLAALVRREPEKVVTVEREELIERIERLVIEEMDDDSIDLTVVQKPDGDGLLS